MELNLNSQRKLQPPFLVDALLVATVTALVCFSLVMIYSTTGVSSQEKMGDSFFYVKRQVVAALIGFSLMFILSRVNVEVLKKLSPFLFVFSVFLLLILFIPGLGYTAGGARRWIRIASLGFEPAEFVKVMFIVFLAGFFARHEGKLTGFLQGVVKPFVLVGALGMLLLPQPDFGSFVVICLVTLVMSLAVGVRIRHLALCGLVLATILGALIAISPYRMSRVLSYRSPLSDASGKGYQLVQSLVAVGTGELTGVGLGGSQQKLFYLPAAHTDFIFAVIAEELGFVGCAALISLFILFLWRGLRLASLMAEDAFSFSLAVGLTMLIVLPALLNVGVVTGLLPTKGMVLPLVGYGGSSLISCLCAVGLLLALARSFHSRIM